MTVDDFTIDRNFLARSHTDNVVHQYLLNSHVEFFAVANDSGRFSLQADKPLYGFRCPAPGLQFKRQAQVNQANNHGCSFEVHMSRHFRNELGSGYNNHGVQPCGACAQRDQGVHIGRVVFEGLPGTDIKMFTRNDHHGECQEPYR